MKYETKPMALLEALATYEPADAELAGALIEANVQPGMLALRDGFDALAPKRADLDEDGLRLLAGVAHILNQGQLFGRQQDALNVLIDIVPGLPEIETEAPPAVEDGEEGAEGEAA